MLIYQLEYYLRCKRALLNGFEAMPRFKIRPDNTSKGDDTRLCLVGLQGDDFRQYAGIEGSVGSEDSDTASISDAAQDTDGTNAARSAASQAFTGPLLSARFQSAMLSIQRDLSFGEHMKMCWYNQPPLTTMWAVTSPR